MLQILSKDQCRVIGVLLEKEITTPDIYPLSINALTNGCNQKSNRDPVVTYSEADVQNIIDELVAMNLVQPDTMSSSRVVKYKHRFCNTEFGDLKLSSQETAIICLLLLRGAQTPGELRTRSNRLAEFNNIGEVEQALSSLQQNNGNPLVTKLEREPGKRESRYMHLFTDVELAVASTSTATLATNIEKAEDMTVRIDDLEQQISDLTRQVNTLYQLLDKSSS